MLTKQEDEILLQRVMGKTSSAIARDIGTTEAEVERVIEDHTDRTLVHDIRKKALALDITRLDFLLQICMSRAAQGDMQAVHAALKCLQRRAVMLGLHTPTLHTLEIVNSVGVRETGTDKIERALNALLEDQRAKQSEGDKPH